MLSLGSSTASSPPILVLTNPGAIEITTAPAKTSFTSSLWRTVNMFSAALDIEYPAYERGLTPEQNCILPKCELMLMMRTPWESKSAPSKSCTTLAGPTTLIVNWVCSSSRSRASEFRYPERLTPALFRRKSTFPGPSPPRIRPASRTNEWMDETLLTSHSRM